jgi:hypothetical protein
MRGATLTIRLSDTITAELQVEFAGQAEAFQGLAKPLLLEVLDRMGLHGDEMNAWKATVSGNTVTLAGPLELATANLLLSPFLRPSASSVAGDETAPAGDDPKAQASLRYFQAVDKKLKEVRTIKNSTYTKMITAYNAAARQIDDLRVLDVDDELLDWGGAVATTLRSMAIVDQATLGQCTMLQANKAMVSVTTPNYYYGSSYGYWGGAGYGYSYAVPSGTASTAVASNYGQVANMQYMTKAQETQYRQNTWGNIDTATTELRRKMVKKYGIEF